MFVLPIIVTCFFLFVYFKFLNRERGDPDATATSPLIDVTLLPKVDVLNLQKPPSESCDRHYFEVSDPTTDCASLCKNPEYGFHAVTDRENFFVDGVKLRPGNYCFKNQRFCDKHKSNILLGADGWECSCRFPEFFSGRQCSTKRRKCVDVIDSTTNKKVPDDADVDFYERLPGGGNRFRCSCGKGTVAHPDVPYECFVDGCLGGLRNSSAPGVDWHRGVCDCGDFNETRQRNVDPKDPKSRCSSCFAQRTEPGVLRQPYSCFNPELDDVYKLRDHYPCIPLSNPSNCGTFDIKAQWLDASSRNRAFFKKASFNSEFFDRFFPD